MTSDEIRLLMESHRKWLEVRPEGKKANLSSADLSSANLRSADLRFADLSFANLSSANLRFANLRSADLRFANLRSADLRFADLSFANLSSANLRSADLRFADLSFANLSDIKVNWQSHELISEILWRAANSNRDRQMIAAWVGRATHLCWKNFIHLSHNEKEWALAELSKWVKDGDGAPSIIVKRST